MLLSACTSGEAETEHQDKGPEVPKGVASQYSVLEEEIGEAGGETTSGPWRIAYIVEKAEPWFEGHNGEQKFHQPAEGETHHIEIIPIEAETGRTCRSLSRSSTPRARSSTSKN